MSEGKKDRNVMRKLGSWQAEERSLLATGPGRLQEARLPMALARTIVALLHTPLRADINAQTSSSTCDLPRGLLSSARDRPPAATTLTATHALPAAALRAPIYPAAASSEEDEFVEMWLVLSVLSRSCSLASLRQYTDALSRPSRESTASLVGAP